jgi:glutaminase
MDFESILNDVYTQVNQSPNHGIVADYIPELGKAKPEKLGLSIHTLDDQIYAVGDADEKFSLQSISKVFALTMAYKIHGEALWSRVGVEPSGSPFNSLVQLEYENGKPRNPFINAGALVICDILCDSFDDPLLELLSFVRQIAGNPAIHYSTSVYESELAYGFKNAAVINLMKSYGNINNDIPQVLEFYYRLCSIEMTCKELAKTFLLFANQGRLLHSGQQIISSSKTKRINAIMQTCGFYDEAGEFSFQVGLPGKSGVGGGIVAVHPNQYTVSVWSPPLNKKGNSFAGMQALELFTTKSGLSIF